MSKPRKKKSRKNPWIGFVHLDLFELHIPVFVDPEARLEGLKHYGVLEPTTIDFPVLGTASFDCDEDGARIYALYFREDAGPETWSHEASHLVDFILNQLGMGVGLKNTELRAYMVGYLTGQIYDLLLDYNQKGHKHQSHSIPVCSCGAPTLH